MRPRNQQARDQIPMLLRRRPGVKAGELATLAGVSQPTLSRMLKELAGEVLALGQGPRRRYYGRRSLRGQPGAFPVYAVDRAGRAAQVGTLELVAPEGTVLDVAAMGWPVDVEFRDGLWPGLPYPLQDMRPQGFLGRSFARHVAAGLGVSDNPRDWSDDDVLHILTQRGIDTSGNLIVGDGALQRWLVAKSEAPALIEAADIDAAYAQRANQASALGAVGSSAAGEFPKFTALRALEGSETPHVIVKFSGAEATGTVLRWADLLCCEHLALEQLRRLPRVPAARTRLLQVQGRTMLETERFDRHGLHGRSALCSLDTLNNALLARTGEDWGVIAAALHAQGWISADTERQIRLVWTYGRLIGNTDMHKGNLSFVPGLPMAMAPVYDMLPMMYAPLGGGELPRVQYAPGLPTPREREVWLQAAAAALAFWESAAQDARISAEFRGICADNRQVLMRLTDLA